MAPLKNSPYAPGIKELLNTLDTEGLFTLASTATNNRIMTSSRNEAINLVLQFTESLGRLFSYRRLTIQVLFDYLMKKKGDVRQGDNKGQLIEKITQLWEKKYNKTGGKAIEVIRPGRYKGTADIAEDILPPTRKALVPSLNLPSPAHTSPPAAAASATTLSVNISAPGSVINVQVTPNQAGGGSEGGVRSDVFVREFCTWFYNMLNRLQPQYFGVAGDTFSPEVFMGNCSMDMYIAGTRKLEHHTLGNSDTYNLLKGICIDQRLYFVPSLENGTQAIMSDHGLLKLLCCGTLQQDSNMVGVFEQEFGLIKDPVDKWKIMQVKVNLKQVQGAPCLPSIPKGPLFIVEM